jgi:hypothetical protein
MQVLLLPGFLVQGLAPPKVNWRRLVASNTCPLDAGQASTDITAIRSGGGHLGNVGQMIAPRKMLIFRVRLSFELLRLNWTARKA